MKPMRLRGLAIMTGLALLLAACGSAAEDTSQTAPSTSPTTMAMTETSMDMESGEHDHEDDHEHGEGKEWTGSAVPKVDVTVEGDNTIGWTVTADIGDTFQFGTPDNMVHEDGVGHAHLVIDGVVTQMIYEPSVTIDRLEPGVRMIEIRLASSDHSDYLVDGEFIAGMAMVDVPGEVTPADVMVMVTFENGSVTTESDRVDVAVGDIVEIVVTSDVTEEIHLHGYDIIADVAAGETATLRFTAEVPGIFEVELEDSGELLVELVIS